MSHRPPKPKAALEPPTRSKAPVIAAATVVFAVAVGAAAFFSNRSAPATDAAAAASAEPQADRDVPAADAVPAVAKYGPHKQESYPPLPFNGYPPPRPAEVVRAAYLFAAEHPEVLSYIPCFCGCGRQGHKGNHDCFVAERGANGDVVRWDPHGLECTVCIDVAQNAMQMFASGASVRDIRAATDKRWGALYPTSQTPTPNPPAGGQ